MKVYSVSEFVKAISDYLSMGLGSVAVQGEVIDFSISGGKFVWFELKDEDSRIKCFAVKGGFDTSAIANGIEMKVQGHAKLFKKSGQFHIHVQDVSLVGEGALQKQFKLLKEKLTREGVFDEQYKKSLPLFPERIGLITSRDAAAFKDVTIRLNERWSGLSIEHAHVSVQGLGSVPEIVGAIEYFNQHHPVDVLILTRGGGSLEDLQSFNDERVVRAVFSSSIPIVVGVGHERDITLAELASDIRASTPTNATECVVPHRREILTQITSGEQLLLRVLLQKLEQQTAKVDAQVTKLERVIEQVFNRFKHVYQRLTSIATNIVKEQQYKRERVITIQKQLLLQVQQYTQRWNQKVDALSKQYKTLDPKATLKRGYSVSFHKGKVILSSKQLKKGESMQTHFADGEIISTIN